jgi:hypothetical protein
MQAVIDTTETRRAKQAQYNEEHGIEPRTVVKTTAIQPIVVKGVSEGGELTPEDIDVDLTVGAEAVIEGLHREMDRAASELEFEYAAVLRDKIREIEESELGDDAVAPPGMGEPSMDGRRPRAISGRRAHESTRSKRKLKKKKYRWGEPRGGG